MSCNKCANQAKEAMDAAGVSGRQADAAWADGADKGPCPDEQGTAKRLVLVDPDTDDYNWGHIEELERITDNRFIAAALRSGQQIYDLWQDDWDDLVRRAGYDSIATVSIEGPEKYELSTLDERDGEIAPGRR